MVGLIEKTLERCDYKFLTNYIETVKGELEQIPLFQWCNLPKLYQYNPQNFVSTLTDSFRQVISGHKEGRLQLEELFNDLCFDTIMVLSLRIILQGILH